MLVFYLSSQYSSSAIRLKTLLDWNINFIVKTYSAPTGVNIVPWCWDTKLSPSKVNYHVLHYAWMNQTWKVFLCLMHMYCNMYSMVNITGTLVYRWISQVIENLQSHMNCVHQVSIHTTVTIFFHLREARRKISVLMMLSWLYPKSNMTACGVAFITCVVTCSHSSAHRLVKTEKISKR